MLQRDSNFVHATHIFHEADLHSLLEENVLQTVGGGGEEANTILCHLHYERMNKRVSE